MDVILYVNKETTIPTTMHSDYITWEIDDENIDVSVNELNHIILIPGENSLDKPRRNLICRANDTKEMEEFSLTIEAGTPDSTQSNNEETESIDEQGHCSAEVTLPKTVSLPAGDCILIKNSCDYLDGTVWRFASAQNDEYIQINRDGVTIINLPLGIHTLICMFKDKTEYEIMVQVFKKKECFFWSRG